MNARRKITYGLLCSLLILAPTIVWASNNLPFLPGLALAPAGSALIPVPPRVQGQANSLVALQPVYIPGSRGGWSAAVAVGTYSSLPTYNTANDWGDVGFSTRGAAASTGLYYQVAGHSDGTTGYYAPLYYADQRYFGN